MINSNIYRQFYQLKKTCFGSIAAKQENVSFITFFSSTLTKIELIDLRKNKTLI